MRRLLLLAMTCFLTAALPGVALAATGDISTLAGTGISGYNGDDVAGTSARLALPRGVAMDDDGNVYIADLSNNRVRRVDAVTGVITTVAGTGTYGYNGDGILATSAQLAEPAGVAIDGAGNLYIADNSNNRIRRVDAVSGLITTVAGNGDDGLNADGIDATTARLSAPQGVAIDSAGHLFIADTFHSRVRRVDASTGLISTIAGTGEYGYNGDDIAATAAQFRFVWGIALDADDNLYIADSWSHRVRRVDATSGVVTTVAGTGVEGFGGDGAAATAAQLDSPYAVAVDPDGNLFIADTMNQRIRRVDSTTGLIITVAGTGVAGFNGDGIPAATAQLAQPWGLALDADGSLLISDATNFRVRWVETPDTDGDGFADNADNFPDVYSRCRLRQATIIGTESADILNGTSGADVIMGFGGADIINGNGGDDLICAGNGADIITGGDGKDRIYAENGTDTVYGNEKSDRIYGGDGNDTLYGNGGTRDRLFGGDGTDTLNGGTGTDDRCTLGETYANCEVIF
jgi:sugar lactone lactonase YvrE